MSREELRKEIEHLTPRCGTKNKAYCRENHGVCPRAVLQLIEREKAQARAEGAAEFAERLKLSHQVCSAQRHTDHEANEIDHLITQYQENLITADSPQLDQDGEKKNG